MSHSRAAQAAEESTGGLGRKALSIARGAKGALDKRTSS